MLKKRVLSLNKVCDIITVHGSDKCCLEYIIQATFVIGPFRGGNKPPVLPGEEKGFSKAKNGELKAAEVVAKN